jgi:hypothetical protein
MSKTIGTNMNRNDQWLKHVQLVWKKRYTALKFSNLRKIKCVKHL